MPRLYQSILGLLQFISVQSLSHIQLFVTPWTPMTVRQASLSITNSQSLLKLMSIELEMPPTLSSSVVPCSSCPQSFPASGSFQMRLIIYVSLLLLTPKILGLPFDAQDNEFLSWAHSYAAFHNQTAGSVEHSLLHQWKASRGGHLHFKKKTFSKSANTFNDNRMWCLFLNWWHLTILRWTDLTMDMTFNFDFNLF